MNDLTRERGRKFLETEYNAHIGEGAMRFNVMTTPRWLITDGSALGYPDKLNYETLKSVDISMRPDDFARLTSLMGWYSMSSGDYAGYSRYVEQNLAMEREIRKNYPAVRKSYEKYQMLLKMVNDGREINE